MCRKLLMYRQVPFLILNLSGPPKAGSPKDSLRRIMADVVAALSVLCHDACVDLKPRHPHAPAGAGLLERQFLTADNFQNPGWLP